MKQTVKRFSTVLLALLLTLTMIVSAAVAFAQSGVFAEEAYTDLVTFSDCQSFGPGAFNNFGKVLRCRTWIHTNSFVCLKLFALISCVN